MHVEPCECGSTAVRYDHFNDDPKDFFKDNYYVRCGMCDYSLTIDMPSDMGGYGRKSAYAMAEWNVHRREAATKAEHDNRPDIDFSFEVISENCHRAKVLGGWLVKTFEGQPFERGEDNIIDDYSWNVAMAFVPDPSHEWRIAGEEKVICPSCDKALPEGCDGKWKADTGKACWLNRE